MKIWHYTVAKYLPSILEDKEIKLATAFIPKNQKKVIWFSTNPIWEETANKMIGKSDGRTYRGTKESTHQNGGGLARIQVPLKLAPYTWQDYKRMRAFPKRIKKSLEDVAIRDGANPNEWRFSFYPCPKEKWISVELFNWDKQVWEDFFIAYERVIKRYEKTKKKTSRDSHVQAKRETLSPARESTIRSSRKGV